MVKAMTLLIVKTKEFTTTRKMDGGDSNGKFT